MSDIVVIRRTAAVKKKDRMIEILAQETQTSSFLIVRLSLS